MFHCRVTFHCVGFDRRLAPLSKRVTLLFASSSVRSDRNYYTITGGGPDESSILANQAGYLRLGIEMLKAAFASGGRRGAKEGLDVDLSYLTDRDSEIQFDWFERNESLVTPSSKPSRRRQFAGALLALAGGLALVALVIGAVTIIKWFVAWP